MNTQYKQLTQKDRGFTIIEVVLVLAIAGLIFLMVFLALPALQRGQRDTGRKDDVSRTVTAVQTYLSNNKGSFTTALTSATLQKYVGDLSQYDNTSVTVNGTAASTANITATTSAIYVRTGVKCPTSMPAPGTLTLTPVAGASRNAIVVTALENDGTNNQVFCQEL